MLTEMAIKSLAASEKRREVPDGKVRGLYLVVQSKSGAKSWAVRYRVNGKSRKHTLGPYPTTGLAEARRRAVEALGAVAGGKDPGAEKMAARAKGNAAKDDAVEAVVDDFIRHHAKPQTRDWRETERILKKDVVSRWRGRRLGEIERRHVAKLLDEIVERGAPVGANRVFAQLRKMCAWAAGRGVIPSNPCAGVPKPSAEVERDRVLDDRDLALILRGAERLGFPFGPIVRLLILTGQRRDEVGGLPWAEIDLDAKDGALWTLPAARSKNRREHLIPLSASAAEIVRATPHLDDSLFLFSAGPNPPSGFAKAKERLDARVAKLAGEEKVAHWTLHDLRRTCASGMAKLGVDPHVVEAVLNHKSGTIRGVAAIYNRYSYADEKRDALDRWAEHVEGIVKADGGRSDG